MDKTKITAAVVVATIVVAAVAALAMSLGNSSNEKTSTGEGRLLVFGNADNDDYLDFQDIDKINEIISSGTWDKDTYPLADANCDGVMNQTDVTYLQNLLDGNSGRMYYIDAYGDTRYFNYPLGDKKIVETLRTTDRVAADL